MSHKNPSCKQIKDRFALLERKLETLRVDYAYYATMVGVRSTSTFNKVVWSDLDSIEKDFSNADMHMRNLFNTLKNSNPDF